MPNDDSSSTSSYRPVPDPRQHVVICRRISRRRRRPSEVVLRVKGKPGDKKSSTCEMQYKLTAPDGKIVGPITLTGHINCEVSAADDKQTTRRFSFTKFDSKDDTIGLADMMNKSFMLQFTGSITSDARGNSLHQTGYSKPPESYNFPEGPVKVGDTWQGWLGKHETQKADHLQARKDHPLPRRRHRRDLERIARLARSQGNGMVRRDQRRLRRLHRRRGGIPHDQAPPPSASRSSTRSNAIHSPTVSVGARPGARATASSGHVR